jgi:hypothetical protein
MGEARAGEDALDVYGGRVMRGQERGKNGQDEYRSHERASGSRKAVF